MMRPDPIRMARMCQLYREGHTLQQIGTVYGLSRERIRQIVSKAGVVREEGGIARKAQARKESHANAKRIRKDAAARALFGCSYAEVLAMNGGRGGWVKGTLGRAFVQQRRSAIERGIEWRMTLREWLDVWEKSGRLDARGRTSGGYVMARKQDFGPYAPWNVYVTTLAQNVADYQAELKRRGVECVDGYKRLPERAKAIGVAA